MAMPTTRYPTSHGVGMWGGAQEGRSGARGAGVNLMWRIVFKGMLGLGVGGDTTVTVSTLCIPEKSIVSTNTNYDMMLPVLDY